uniref:Uncharacterized protein n=1 Tax=Micrurus surinamensis TaxID=129470 RepID=A0A2D4PNK8_MICSU
MNSEFSSLHCLSYYHFMVTIRQVVILSNMTSAIQTEYKVFLEWRYSREGPVYNRIILSTEPAQKSCSVQGVILDKFSGDTRRVGVLLAESEEGSRKGVAAVSVVDVSP